MTGAPIDLLYRLTRRDEAYPHWGTNHGNVNASAANVLVNTTLAGWDAGPRPPNGTILFITNLLAQGTPGAGQITVDLQARLLNRRTDAVVGVLLRKQAVVAPFPQPLIVQSVFDVAIQLDRFYLQVIATFDAGVNANAVSIDWSGYVVPQGEIGFS